MENIEKHQIDALGQLLFKGFIKVGHIGDVFDGLSMLAVDLGKLVLCCVCDRYWCGGKGRNAL